MVVPNGPSLARCSSTWIHWWSWVTSAKASICGCVTIVHGVGPNRGPRESASSAYGMVRDGAMTSGMEGPLLLLGGGRSHALAQPALGDGPAVCLRRAVVDAE